MDLWRAVATWRSRASLQANVKKTSTKIVSRWKNHAFASAFQRWSQVVGEKASLKRTAVKALGKFLNRLTNMALARWCSTTTRFLYQKFVFVHLGHIILPLFFIQPRFPVSKTKRLVALMDADTFVWYRLQVDGIREAENKIKSHSQEGMRDIALEGPVICILLLEVHYQAECDGQEGVSQDNLPVDHDGRCPFV